MRFIMLHHCACAPCVRVRTDKQKYNVDSLFRVIIEWNFKEYLVLIHIKGFLLLFFVCLLWVYFLLL